jgi:hypothetical protein
MRTSKNIFWCFGTRGLNPLVRMNRYETLSYCIAKEDYPPRRMEVRRMLDKSERLALKAEIVRRGLKMYEVAAAIDVNENAFSAYLCGRRHMPAVKVEALKAFLGVESATVGVE